MIDLFEFVLLRTMRADSTVQHNYTNMSINLLRCTARQNGAIQYMWHPCVCFSLCFSGYVFAEPLMQWSSPLRFEWFDSLDQDKCLNTYQINRLRQRSIYGQTTHKQQRVWQRESESNIERRKCIRGVAWPFLLSLPGWLVCICVSARIASSNPANPPNTINRCLNCGNANDGSVIDSPRSEVPIFTSYPSAYGLSFHTALKLDAKRVV